MASTKKNPGNTNKQRTRLNNIEDTVDSSVEVASLISDNLSAYPAEKSLAKRSTVSTSENSKKYSVKMSPPKPCAVYQVDGVVVKQGNKCDKLVLVETDIQNHKWTEIFVELKGVDVSHAVKQLEATIKNPVFEHSTINNRWARIVASSIPKNTGNSVIERARDKFKKDYNVSLKAWSSNNQDYL